MDIKYDVLGIGNAIIDIISSVDISFLNENNLNHGSMTLVEEDESLKIQKVLKNKKLQAGGSVANTIAGIAILGGNCAFIGKRKRDILGNAFYKSMKDLNIDMTDASLNVGPSSASCIVMVTSEGQRTMCTHLGISTKLDENDINESYIKDSKIIYLEGYLFDLPSARKAFIKAGNLARKHNRKIAFSLSDSFCVDRHRNRFKEFIHNYVDILFGNEDEIKSLYQSVTLETASNKISTNVDIALITKGSEGVIAFKDKIKYEMQAKKVQVLDTTGAGDLFASGFLHGFSLNWKFEDSIKAGIICASEIIKDFGARPSKDFKNIFSKNNL